MWLCDLPQTNDPMKTKTNKFYAYIRVSTKDQERGASLGEQKRQIEDYAHSKDFEITREYKEVQSASKIGRIQFAKMVKEIEKDGDNIRGVIFHAVDRSARNPFDQAKLYELKQAGYEPEEIRKLEGEINENKT